MANWLRMPSGIAFCCTSTLLGLGVFTFACKGGSDVVMWRSWLLFSKDDGEEEEETLQDVGGEEVVDDATAGVAGCAKG